jgi:hypothetical protein
VHLAHYLGFAQAGELDLAEGFVHVAETHRDEPDVYHLCLTLGAQCVDHARRLQPFAERYGEQAPEEPDRLYADLFGGTRSGPLGLLRDLHDLYIMASASDMAWTLLAQAAQALRDRDLLAAVTGCERETQAQLRWLRTRLKQAAPQALVTAR